MKKVIGLILMLTVSVVFAGTYSGGSGTSANPYQINNLNDLQELSTTSGDWDSYFIQIADIDASDSDTMNVGDHDDDAGTPDSAMGFSPIGNTITEFTGEYNGQGHTIDSLFIDRPNADYIGLFGYTDGSEIDSVGVTNVDITGDGLVGGLVGYNDASTVSNSYSTGSVSGSGRYVGGLVGYNDASTVSNSYSTGSVGGSSRVGGLVGINDNSSTVSNSYSTGSVSGGWYVGGLVGSHYYSTVSNSYSAGSVSGDDYVGGLVGDNHYSPTVNNSFWDRERSGQSSSAGGLGKTTTEMTDLDLGDNCFYSAYWDFVDSTANGTDDYWNQGNNRNDNYPYLAWQYPSDELGLSGTAQLPTSTPPSGSGTEGNPYKIANIENLHWLSQNDSVWSKYFIQTEDIDVDYEYMKKWAGGQGFSPIGNNSTKFTGEYNGQGHTIDSLFIDRPSTQNIGLFGRIDGSKIDSVGLTNVDITGDDHIGGLVGYNNHSSTVSNSYSTGSVSGNNDVGGLVGYNDYSTVSNSYSTGSVSGNSRVGGLVGYNYYLSTVSNSYSTGSVSGNNDVGGLVGYNIGSTVSNSFWDRERSGQSSSAGGLGKTTAEMTDLDLGDNCFYSAYWDFVDSTANGTDDYWNQGNDRNDNYPYLAWQYPSDDLGLSGTVQLPTSTPPSGNGTEGDPYKIANIENLYWLSQNDSVWSKYFIQTEDIDVDYEYMKKWVGGYGFSPIGNDSINFTGEYNGQGHTIDSLFIDHSGTDYIGLFGYALGAEIDSVGVTNVDITGNGFIGGLVGYNDASTVSNSYSTGSVSGSGNDVGGLVGYNYNSSTVSNSYSTGSVSGSGSDVGGLVGYNNYYSTVSNSYSTGSVSGNNDVGGLVGSNVYSSTVSNSYSTGSVSGSGGYGYVGGLVGLNGTSSTVNNSFWDRERSGQSSSAGGLGKTTAEMTDLDLGDNCFYWAYWDFVDSTANGTDDYWNQGNDRNDNYPYLAWQYPSDELGLSGTAQLPTSTPPSGSGTEGDPYKIANIENLHWLSQNDSVWSKYFIQTEDIDVDYEYMKKWAAGQGFSPIGNDGTKFTGEYNGQGHTIDSLFIDRPNAYYIGLFGYTDGTEIDSVGLTNVDITGDDYVGGLVGENSSSSTVSNSYSTGSVSGNSRVGGLVGENSSSSTVSNSYSTGGVSGSGGYVGGLVGYNYYYSTVSNSYSTGSVSGDYSVGGLVGNNNSTVSNSFWDLERSGQSSSDGGTGKMTADMKNVATYTDTSASTGLYNAWDFIDNPNDDSQNNDIWEIDTLNDGYPYLAWQKTTDTTIDDIQTQNQTPIEFSLKQNYPNPFNPTTTIAYQLPKSSRVQLAIYNMLGQKVKILVNEKQDAGKYQVVLNGSNLSSGIYFYRLQTDKRFSETRKLVLLK
ncbi:MAG: GLUG motif-containing protein [Candidatus Marinimicrobia bacterium]|nr:GLUG motif-containing protein [Candidatus Neomarinimicrobiota bacterium]